VAKDLLAGIPAPSTSAGSQDLLTGIPAPKPVRAMNALQNVPAPAQGGAASPPQPDSGAWKDMVRAMVSSMGLRITSDNRPGAITVSGHPSLHSTGHALDIGGAPEKLATMFDYIRRTYPGQIREMFYSPAGFVKNGKFFKSGAFNQAVEDTHQNHLHIALVDPADVSRIGQGPLSPPKPAPAPRATAKAPVVPGQKVIPLAALQKGGAQPAGRISLQQASAMPEPGVDPRSVEAGLGAVVHPVLKAGRAVGNVLGAGSAGLTAFQNEMKSQVIARAKAGKKTGVGTPRDFRDLGTALAAAGQAGIQAAGKAAKTGDVPSYDVVSGLLGMTPENSNPTAYGLVRAGEQLLPIAQDPLNFVGPGLERAGVAVAGKLAKPLGRAVTAVASRFAPGATAALAARAAGKQAITDIIKPATMAFKNRVGELQQVVQDANAELGTLRKSTPAVNQAVKATGEHPVWDLARKYAAADTGRLAAQGKVSIGAADAQALAAEAAARGVPQKAIAEVGDRLAQHINGTINAMRRAGVDPLVSTTRRAFTEAYLAPSAKGTLDGVSIARKAHEAELMHYLAPIARPAAAPGLTEIPKTATYGPLAGTFLPKNLAEKVVKGAEFSAGAAIPWSGIVRRAKNAILFQATTPVAIAGAHASGAEMALRRVGGGATDYLAQAPGAMKELWQYWTKGKLSTSMREFSQFDDSFLRRLDHVKVADGVAGKVVNIAGKSIQLPTRGEAVAGLFSKEKGLLNPISSEHVFLKAHGAVDQAARLGLWKALRNRGVDPQKAAELVGRYVISWADRPDVLARLDQSGAWAFSNVPYKMALIAAETAAKRPDLLARPGQLQQRMLKSFGQEGAYQQVPEDRRNPFQIPNPLKPDQIIDYSRHTPISEPYQWLREATELTQNPPGPVDLVRTAMGHSIFTPAFQMYANLTGSGKPIVHPGAPVEEQYRQAGRFVKDIYQPLSKFAGQVTAMGERRATSDSPFAEPQTPAELALQRLALRPVKPESREQRIERLSPEVDKRSEISQKYLDIVEARMDRMANPYVARMAGITDPVALQKQGKDTADYLRQQMLSPANIGGNQKVTAEGQRKIREARLQLRAIELRLDQLDQQEEQAQKRAKASR
jgi:hypothetical protein